MKQVLVIIFMAFLMTWYAGIGKVKVCERDNENYLSTAEIAALDNAGVLKSPVDYTKRYYTTHKVTYLLKRGFIPLTYKRDTVSNAGLNYYSKE